MEYCKIGNILFRERASKDPDTMVTVDDLEKFEDEHGRIPDAAVVIMRSGWGAK